MATPNRRRRLLVLAGLCAALAAAVLLTPFADAATKPALVQRRNVAITEGDTLRAKFPRANRDGDAIVAYVVWDNSGSVTLTDTSLNAYESAVGATPAGGESGLRAQIFYARNVVGKANEVIATFATPIVGRAELYVFEYTGLSHVAPLDAAAAGAGDTPEIDSGELVTHASEELLFFAVASDSRAVSRLSRGFRARAAGRGILVADGFAGDAGAYRAEARQSGSGWVAQLVAFNYSGPRPKGAAKFPVKVGGPDNHYLVGQDDKPFLLTGDSPQSLFVNLSTRDAASYFANRKARGFNAVWINLINLYGTGGRDRAATYDGITPFTRDFDLSTPNEAYFARVDEFLRLAARNGITVLLNPAETIDWIDTLKGAGVGGSFAYGQYLGRRYRGFDNIVWIYGNDFQSWSSDGAAVAVVQAVARGIQDTDPAHLHTVQLDFEVSGSLDDPSWGSLIDLSASYTYAPTYAQILEDRDRGLPTFLIEANYDLETTKAEQPGILFERHDDARPRSIRKQAWWAMLSGATGHVYGNGYVWPFLPGWKTRFDSKAARQMGHLRKLLESVRWQELEPDERHSLVTAGFGEFSDGDPSPTPDGGDRANVKVSANDYVTAAATPDGTQAIIYIPAQSSITVDMRRFPNDVIARWFDPTNGRFRGIRGSPFRNTDQLLFTSPGPNGDRDPDWVLVLEAD